MKNLLILFFVLIFSTVCGAQYEYLLKFKVDDKAKEIGAVWQVDKTGNTTVIHEVTAGMTQTVKCGENWSAFEWSMQSKMKEGGDVDLKGYRKDNRIYVDGILDSKPYSKVFDIDDRPWYQAIDMQMADFIASDKDYRDFWMVGMKPDFDVWTMEMRKGMTETVKVLGKDTPCWKLEWRMTGFFSRFWSSDYWFRMADSIAVKFAMPGGNDPKATSELVREKQ